MRVHFHFHGELNDFLESSDRDHGFDHFAGPTDTLKHVIESIGVPHTEIGLVTVNGPARDLSSAVSEGDEVNVFPPKIPIVLDNPRFVADGHLGRLAAYLRMLGFDTWYDRYADDPTLASVSAGENRLLLTRDVGLLKRREVALGYCVRSDQPHQQLQEVTLRFDLQHRFAPFSRCMECNGVLQSVPKAAVEDVLPPHTRATKEEFSRCLQCGKIFWRGSHHARMLGWIDALVSQAAPLNCGDDDHRRAL